jgi:hypothetical protein
MGCGHPFYILLLTFTILKKWTIDRLLEDTEYPGIVGSVNIGSWVIFGQRTNSIGKQIFHNMDPSWSDIKTFSDTKI